MTDRFIRNRKVDNKELTDKWGLLSQNCKIPPVQFINKEDKLKLKLRGEKYKKYRQSRVSQKGLGWDEESNTEFSGKPKKNRIYTAKSDRFSTKSKSKMN